MVREDSPIIRLSASKAATVATTRFNEVPGGPVGPVVQPRDLLSTAPGGTVLGDDRFMVVEEFGIIPELETG